MSPSGGREGAPDKRCVVLDAAGEHPQLDDLAGRLGNDVDDLDHGWSIGITSDNDGARDDHAGVARLVEERPDEAGFVLVVQVGGDVDGDGRRSSLSAVVWSHDTGWL
jgi:hypothetical protein